MGSLFPNVNGIKIDSNGRGIKPNSTALLYSDWLKVVLKAICLSVIKLELIPNRTNHWTSIILTTVFIATSLELPNLVPEEGRGDGGG